MTAAGILGLPATRLGLGDFSLTRAVCAASVSTRTKVRV
jgi:hypothetical protein